MTNFLQEGALLRHQDQWVLLEGPFIEKSFHNSSDWSVYVSDFYDFKTEKEWVGAKTHILSNSELRSLLNEISQKDLNAEGALATADWQEPQKKWFETAFLKIQEKIQTGEIQKAVPVVFSETQQSVTQSDLIQMMIRLLEAPQNLYVYGFWKNQNGFLGATPEILFRYKEKNLFTMALAGTCPKDGNCNKENFLKDPKERVEHDIVVQDLKLELKSLGELTFNGPFVMELPSLLHLRTDIEVSCFQTPDPISLLKKLHPTPALGVAPRSFGTHWMKSFSGQEKRQRFGAPIGFFRPSEGLCLIGIRNIQWDQYSARIGSGCGIVQASELEREWHELSQKRQSVRKILGL